MISFILFFTAAIQGSQAQATATHLPTHDPTQDPTLEPGPELLREWYSSEGCMGEAGVASRVEISDIDFDTCHWDVSSQRSAVQKCTGSNQFRVIEYSTSDCSGAPLTDVRYVSGACTPFAGGTGYEKYTYELDCSTLSEGQPCGCEVKGSLFCDFVRGTTGDCQSCVNFLSPYDCYSDRVGLSSAGAADCVAECFDFAQGDMGVNACPNGYVAITDGFTCADAAYALGLNYDAAENDRYVSSDTRVCSYCSGCKPATVQLTRSHRNSAQWICQATPGVQNPSKSRMKAVKKIYENRAASHRFSRAYDMLQELVADYPNTHYAAMYEFNYLMNMYNRGYSLRRFKLSRKIFRTVFGLMDANDLFGN